ncbi:MAG: restriction endonuclease subunit S [Kiritimatiellae bacterium]|jgi:type I restriction enzyme S subunit|nr:restriction endonuclease subunit S [Kiritimatiellia bacterium]
MNNIENIKTDVPSLPKGWKIKNLGDVCEIKPSKGQVKKKLKDNDLVSFFPMTDLQVFNHYIKAHQTRTLSDVYKGYVYFENNDVLLAKITPCFENGKLGIAKNLKNGVGFGSSEYMVFRPTEQVMSEYIYHFLSRDYIRTDGKRKMTGAVGHKRIPVEYLATQNIIIPPLPEQKRIVSILDEAFSVIERSRNITEKNLQNAKELFQSKLQSIFDPSTSSATKIETGDDTLSQSKGWKEKTFEELSSKIGDGLHGTPKYDSSGNYFFINGNNLNDGVIEIKENTKRVNEIEYKKHCKQLMNNTVLISINGTLGNVAFYNNEPIILGKSACYINFYDNIEKKYIKYLVQSPIFFENMVKASTGATIKNFSLKSMRNYKIALPPLLEQKRIVTELDALGTECKKLELIYQQKFDSLEELKKSILQKAFNGEL